jgi:Calcium-dependent channel, 7TM region, putative phosphate
LGPLQDYLNTDTNSYVGAKVASALTPLVLFAFNYVFIPTLVDFISYYEEYETKSMRHKNNLYKQWFFMLINMIFLPMLNITTIQNFFSYLTTQELETFQVQLATRSLITSEFYLKYLIQMTFLTNIIQILDIPHYIYMSVKRCFSKKKYYEEELIDDWYFDLGYHYAYAIVIFTLVFIFSASAPLIPVFGFLFFTFKVISHLTHISTTLTSTTSCSCTQPSSSPAASSQTQ